MLLHWRSVSRLVSRQSKATARPYLCRTHVRGYSDSVDDPIKRLQNAFKTPGSPFYLAPGERGPAEPHNWPDHDPLSSSLPSSSNTNTGTRVEAVLVAATESVSSSSIQGNAMGGTDEPYAPNHTLSSSHLGWPHNRPEYTESRTQAAAYAQEHHYHPESMVEWPVAWGEQDQFRHVNNVSFARYFETARVRVMQAFEPFMTPKSFQHFMNGTGMGLVVKSVLVEYKRPVTFPDSLVIMSAPVNVDQQKASFGLRQAAWSLVQNKVVATCTSVQVMYDFENLKKGVMTAEVKAALDGISARCSQGR